MDLAKIIKIYFVFMIVTVSLGTLTYSKNFVNYAASVLHTTEMTFKSGSANAFDFSDLAEKNSGKDVFVANNLNPNIINFGFVNDLSEAYASPGDENVMIMGLYFKTNKEGLLFEDLTFKIEGVDSETIQRAVLRDNYIDLKEAKHSDEYLVFKNVDFEIGADSEKTLYLYLDLDDSLSTGQRIRLDIETPDDLVLSVGDEPYVLNKYYPIKGKYLSIARNRPWTSLKN